MLFVELTQGAKAPIGVVMSFLGGLVGYRYFASYLQRRAGEQAIERYVSVSNSRWEANCSLLPADLIEAFCALRSILVAEGPDALSCEIRGLMPDLQRQIYNHFPDRYKHRLRALDDDGAQHFFHKIISFNFDFARILNGLGHLIHFGAQAHRVYSDTQAQKEERAEKKRKAEKKEKREREERAARKAAAQPAPPPTYGGDTGQGVAPPSYGEATRTTPGLLYPQVSRASAPY